MKSWPNKLGSKMNMMGIDLRHKRVIVVQPVRLRWTTSTKRAKYAYYAGINTKHSISMLLQKNCRDMKELTLEDFLSSRNSKSVYLLFNFPWSMRTQLPRDNIDKSVLVIVWDPKNWTYGLQALVMENLLGKEKKNKDN